MTQTVILGFGYRAQNGKDTAVAHLVEQYGGRYDVRQYAFATALKTLFYDLLLQPLHEYWSGAGRILGSVSYLALPHPRNEFAGDAEKLAWIAEHKTELGNHLQVCGTEYVRRKDPFYWVKALRKQIESERPQIALISDVRFLNEVYYVKAFNGFTVKVTRIGYALNDGRSSQHHSETELDNYRFDFEISVLDGEVDELKRDATYVFEEVLKSFEVKTLDGLAVADLEVA